MKKVRILSSSILWLSCFLTAAALVSSLSIPTLLDAAPFAYIANRGDGTISVIDIATDTVTSTLTLSGTLLGVTVNNAGTRAYFSRVYQTGITAFDMTVNEALGTFYASGTVHGIAVSPDGARLFVGLRDSGAIEVLDANTGGSITMVGGMSNPTGIAVAPDGGRVYVANWGGTVTVVDALTLGVIETVTGLGNLSGIAVSPDGTRVYTCSTSALYVIDTSTYSVAATVPGLGTGDFTGVAVSPSGERVYAGSGSNVSVIDAASNTVLTSIPTGVPMGIDIDPSGAKVYAAIPSANSVKVIDTATNTVTATIPVGSSPNSFGKFIVPPRCSAPPSGLVSWWSGDGHPLDLMGTNNGTMMSGATYADGKVGKAFSFTGEEDSYVEITNDPILNPPGAFTIDGWFYIDPGASGNAGEIGTLVSKSEGSLGNGWALYFDDRSGVGSSKSLKFVTSSIVELQNAIPAPDWYHIAGVYDPSAMPRTKLYLHGIVVADSSAQTGGISLNSLNVRIGAMYWTDTYHQGNDRLNGKADEVEIFNRALTAEEIAAIHNAGSAGKCKPCVPPSSGLVSWWTADGDANDVFGPSNGTLMNGATFAAGKVGQAFFFNGIDQYVEVSNSPLWNFGSDDFSIHFWINYDGNDAHFIGHDNGGYTQNKWIFYLNNGKLAFHLNGPSVSSVNIGNLPYSFAPNRWHHLAVTRSGDTYTFYVNGAPIGTGTDNQAIPDATAPLTIGQAEGLKYVHGLMDEIQIFNRALSADEIAIIQAAGNSGVCIPLDTTPDAFTFYDQTGVTLSSLIESNVITVSGINVPSAISITNGEYEINESGAWTAAAGTVNNGDAVKVRQTSSSNFSTITDATLTIGGVSDTFSVNTLAADTTPDVFTFIDRTDVPLSTWATSDSITVSGINTAASVSIAGGQYSIDGGDYTSTSGTATNGQTVTVRVMSSASWSTTTSATLSIGGESGTFNVTTMARPQYTITGSVPGGHGTISCDSPVLHGNNSDCTITPDSGYLLKSLADNGTDVLASVFEKKYTIVNATANHTVEGVFAKLLIGPKAGTIGTILEVKGVGLGSKKGKVVLQAGATVYALKVLEWNIGDSGVIKGQLTKGILGGAVCDVVVSLKGVSPITEAVAFEVKKPEVTEPSSYEGKIGATVTIDGKFFGYKKGKVFLEAGGVRKSCKVVSWPATPETGTGTAEIQFVVPKVATGAYNLVIQNTVGEDTSKSFTVLP